MKKLLGIVVLSLLISGKVNAKDLTGVQLLCDGYREYTAMGIDFKSSNTGTFYEIKNENNWIIEKDEINYRVTPDYIFMEGKKYKYKPSLYRKNLKLNDTFQCHKFDKKKNFEALMNFVLEELKNDSEKDNKL